MDPPNAPQISLPPPDPSISTDGPAAPPRSGNPSNTVVCKALRT